MINSTTPLATSGLQERLLHLADQLHQSLVKYEARHDSRAIFTYAYVKITRTLAHQLPMAGFSDPAWVVSLAEHFAAHYVAALEASEVNSSSLPPAWKVVFDTIGLQRTSVLEDLLLAMTAHIVHDLPLSLVEVALTAANGQSNIYDFHRMNDVLAVAIQPIANGVTARYEPFFRWLDQLDRRHTMLFTNYGFRLSRGMAWYNATRLLDVRSNQAALASLTKSVATLVDDVRNPPVWSLHIVFWALRFVVAWFRHWPRRDDS